MPVAPPFPSSVSTAQPVNNSLYPALYLYPLNDTWAPKHITLSNQHTKIGRQTSSKTAPGERNGFFDSKVLSRQHAEVWEESGKIFIRDVRSSNGTFINGERLSSEGQESEPFELKSDDIVEFGIDIVGDDNKTIIHHKVAARVVCVFNEQDAQIAARAEKHQQQHLQHQQFLQQQQAGQGSPSPLTSVTGAPPGSSIIGGSGGPQNFPFAAAQRRAQLAQQGLGGMGGVRPPGKTGLSFDVILSRLQGELQKSRETGSELNSLTGTMKDINDTLGGNLPSNLPPLPGALPPVRAPHDPNAAAATSSSAAAGGHASGAASPDHHSQPPAAPNSSGSLQDLQDQLRETQSSLASHKEKVRTLEEVLAEQELLKQDVKLLKEFMEERRRDLEMRAVEETMSRYNDQVQRGRSFDRGGSERERRVGDIITSHDGFDFEDDDGLHDILDDEDDTRSIATAVPHSLERVDEEDEDHLESEHEQVDEPESVRPLEEEMLGVVVGRTSPFTSSTSDESLAENGEGEAEEEGRRREDFNVRRPRTPEPRLGLVPSARRSSLSSPHQVSSSDHNNETDDIFEQVVRLSKQLSSVIQVTKTLEAQHHDAQDTIKGLETKVTSLEFMLRTAEEALATVQASKKVEDVELAVEVEDGSESMTVEEGKQYSSLVDLMAEWKKSVEGQWSSVRGEWADERERLAKARDEFESKLRQVDNGLERVASLQTTLLSQQQQIQAQFQQQQQQISALNSSHTLSNPFLHHNGDAIKHYGGLVTPPSPRSQSSDSGRYRRRRRRSSGSRGNTRAGSSSPMRLDKDEIEENDDGVDADTDATLASSTEDDLEAKARSRLLGEAISSAAEEPGSRVIILHGNQLATPASSVGSLEVDITSLNNAKKSRGGGIIALLSTRSNPEAMASHTFLLFDTLRRALLILVSCVAYVTPGGDLIEQTSSTHPPTINMHTAAGVVLLSIAAAAVFWKVKPE